MKIKFKVKTLLLFILIFLVGIVWLVPTAILGIADSLQATNPEKANLFYERYASYPTGQGIKGNYLHARNLVTGFEKFTKYFDSWGGGQHTNPEDMEKAIMILQEIMEESPANNEKQYYLDSYKMLLDLSIASGDAQMLRDWISFGKETKDDELIFISDIYNGFLLHVNGDRDKAKEIVEKYEMMNMEDLNLEVLKAEIALFECNYEEAIELNSNLFNRNRIDFQEFIFGSVGYYREDWFNLVLEDLQGDNIIRGRITYEGQPLSFVEIYLQPSHGGIRTGGESYIAISDEDGYFQSLGLKDGVYNIGIGIEGSILNDKMINTSHNGFLELDGNDGQINFELKDTLKIKNTELLDRISGEEFFIEWEELEGADYYRVLIVNFLNPYEKSGSTIRMPALDDNGEIDHRETQAIINTEIQRDEIGGYGLGEDGLISPNAVLGSFLPGVDYPVIVEAYDENDRLISSSLPLITYYDKIPSVLVEGSISEGEEMIINQDYPEAIEYYEDILYIKGHNKEALRYLTKIYGIGWKDGEKNIQRAIELGSSYSDLTDNKRLFVNILQGMSIDEIKENLDIYYTNVLGESLYQDDEYYYFLSRYYIASEDWQGARDALKNAGGITEINLFYLNMYFGDYLEAGENAKHLYSSGLRSRQVKDALIDLEENSPANNDKQACDNLLLKLVGGIEREEGKSLYHKTVEEISSDSIKTILYEIYLSRGWDIE